MKPEIHRATGSHFYKYSSLDKPERLEKILLEHEIYVPTRDELNDPADARPLLPVMSHDELLYFLFGRNFDPTLSTAQQKQVVKMLEDDIQRQGPEAYRRTMTEMLHELQKGYRIYSLSKHFDNLNLWAKYAKDHSGFCLEFAREGWFFESVNEVVYSDMLPLDMANPKSNYFYCKRTVWSGEEEVRALLMPGSHATVKIDPHWLTRLILGARVSPENEAQIRGWAKERQPELLVVKARFDTVSQTLLVE
jgi:hypothetical protein